MTCLIVYAASTSCQFFSSSVSIGLTCEGMHVGGDCRGTYSFPGSVTPMIAHNDGCNIQINSGNVFISGTNCPGGSTNTCTVNFLPKMLTFLDEMKEIKEIETQWKEDDKKNTKNEFRQEAPTKFTQKVNGCIDNFHPCTDSEYCCSKACISNLCVGWTENNKIGNFQ